MITMSFPLFSLESLITGYGPKRIILVILKSLKNYCIKNHLKNRKVFYKVYRAVSKLSLICKKRHQKHLTSMHAINQISLSCDWLRPVSNDVLLPCRTKLIELNSTLAGQYSATFESKSCYCRVDCVARQALPCYTAVARLGFKRRTTAVPNSIDKLKIDKNTFKSLLNRFFIFAFCFR